MKKKSSSGAGIFETAYELRRAVPFSQMDETKSRTKLRLVEGRATGRTTALIRSGGTTAFTYDFESRVTSITKPGMTTNSYSYNGLIYFPAGGL